DGAAPRARQKRGGTQQHRSALVVGGRRPNLPRRERGADGVVDVLGAADRVLGDGQLVAVGRLDRAAGGAPASLATDLDRHLRLRVGQLGQTRFEALAVGITGCVSADRLVDRRGYLEMSVGGHRQLPPLSCRRLPSIMPRNQRPYRSTWLSVS